MARWKDKDYVRKMGKSLNIRPNGGESFLEQMLQEWLPGQYKYVGNYQIVIGMYSRFYKYKWSEEGN